MTLKIDKKVGLVLSGGGGRGSYEVGVLRYFYEQGIIPGIVAGTSVGAINGAAIASGMSIAELEDLWLKIRNRHIFRYSLWQNIKGLFKPVLTSFFETSPLRKLLNNTIDFNKIRQSQVKLYVPAVDLQSGNLDIFSNQQISIDHIVASASIPIVFPWTVIGSRIYWDGGLVANTPISPVLEAGASEIYAILLSPHHGEGYPIPRNKLQAIERLLDFTLMGSFETVFHSLNPRQINAHEWRIRKRGFSRASLKIIKPRAPMNLISILNFSQKQAKQLLRQGYIDAKQTLEDIASAKNRH